MWVKCMYNWVVNGILASLNNKELLIFDSGNDSLYIESTNWLLCWKKKTNVFLENERSRVLGGKSGGIWSGLSAITKMEGSTNSAKVIKRENILNFPVCFFLLCVITGFTFHFVSLSSVTICHNCFLFVYRVFFEVLKHSIVQKWNGTRCKLAVT